MDHLLYLAAYLALTPLMRACYAFDVMVESEDVSVRAEAAGDFIYALSRMAPELAEAMCEWTC
jgi:hypothetical protein